MNICASFDTQVALMGVLLEEVQSILHFFFKFSDGDATYNFFQLIENEDLCHLFWFEC